MSKDGSQDLTGEIDASVGKRGVTQQRTAKTILFRTGGLLMVPVCVLGLFWQQPFIWAICPQALVVMYVRQWQHAYDSLGAADYPDLAVAIFYYPLVGWLLSRAAARGRLLRVAVQLLVWHHVAFGLAVGTAMIRNYLWRF